MRFGLAVLLMFGAYVSQARAALIQYELSGVYQDGQTLSGGFYLDTTKPISEGLFGSTVTLSKYGTYNLSGGGAKSAVGDNRLVYDFLNDPLFPFGIPEFAFTGSYSSATQTVFSLDTGPITGSIYGFGNSYGSKTCLGPCNMFLINGTLSAVPEPFSLTLLGTALLGAVGLRRKRTV